MKTASCKTYNFNDGTYSSSESIHRDMLDLTVRLNKIRASMIKNGYLTHAEELAYQAIELGIKHGELIMSARRACKKLMVKLGVTMN
jgi:hypothetical protein